MKKNILMLTLLLLGATSAPLVEARGGSSAGAFLGGAAVGSLITAGATSGSRHYARSLEDEVYDLRAENAELREQNRRLERKLRKSRYVKNS